uniref:Retrovirus-related Pol polyprotein from transposon TNT 1-94 n=1 Tax=Tanacetum cinerariifolium TaxID=118510 RepID=A0A699HK75_TANCI|nr:retrovirus-related Pol polyprotein from transposon TNT 1-94 [Tanacetum cinerariifolium]
MGLYNKLDENGVVSRNKSRLDVQGYNQQEGIYFDKTYAPVARLESIRILLAYACAHEFKLFQMDVKGAFLNGFINEEVYVAQPPGFDDFEKSNHVFKLKKALYGLKQAPKAWYDRLKVFLLDQKYIIGLVDNTLFTKKKDSHIIIVQIYIDDIIFESTCQDLCDDFSKILHDEFEMSMMGELNFFLGLQIKQLEDGIFFNQSKYIKEKLKKFGLEDSKPIRTHMSFEIKLTRDKNRESVDDAKYRGMIGSLLYLMASRSDIMFSVCLCARFQEDPKTSQLKAVKMIFRYIKGTTHLGLWYPKRTGADFDHAGDYVDHKSTSGFLCQTFLHPSLEKTTKITKSNNKNTNEFKRIARISVWSCYFVNPYPAFPRYQNLSLPTSYQTAPPSTSIVSLPLSPITSPRISPSKLLTTPKSNLSPLTSPPPASSQPSKQSSSLAINLDPVELIFYTPLTSPNPFFDSLEYLPPRTTNPPPPRSLFDTIDHLANQPLPLPTMEPPLLPLPWLAVKLVKCWSFNVLEPCISYGNYLKLSGPKSRHSR